MCNRDECELAHVNLQFIDTAPIRKGDPNVILGAWLAWYDFSVEHITSPVWGWSNENDVGSSNHLSGTAVDINAPQYPWGQRTMPPDRIAMIRNGLRLFEGTVFWGADWDRADEMHYQMAFPEGDRRLAAFSEKLRQGYLGIYGPPNPDAFPLPQGYYYGPLEGPNESISGFYEKDDPKWIDGLKRWQTAVGVPATGRWDPPTAAMATAVQVMNKWPVSGYVYEGEWNVVIRNGQRPQWS